MLWFVKVSRPSRFEDWAFTSFFALVDQVRSSTSQAWACSWSFWNIWVDVVLIENMLLYVPIWRWLHLAGVYWLSVKVYAVSKITVASSRFVFLKHVWLWFLAWWINFWPWRSFLKWLIFWILMLRLFLRSRVWSFR